jgi:hypothetical protein
MTRKFSNDDAQIAVILVFFLCVVFVGFYWMVLGGVMDPVTSIHNNLTQGAGAPIPISQERQDSLSFLQGVFGAIPILVFILTIISAVILALANKYSVV